MTNRLVTIARFDTPVEAEMARMRLEDSGIPATLAFMESGATLWRLFDALGVVRLDVVEQNARKAAAVLRDMREAASEESASPNKIGDQTCLACGAPMSDDDNTCTECGWTFSSGGESAMPDDESAANLPDDFERPTHPRDDSPTRRIRRWKRPVIWLTVAGPLAMVVAIIPAFLWSVLSGPSDGYENHHGTTAAALCAVGAMMAAAYWLATRLRRRQQQ